MDREKVAPDNTPVRTALWRALHLEIDSPPHVFEDSVGLHVSAQEIAQRYFAGRTDGLRPPNNSEEMLVAST